jgi:hypothetical protein
MTGSKPSPTPNRNALGQPLSPPGALLCRDNGRMLWELAHRRRDAAAVTRVTIDAPGSGRAIEVLRAQVPADEVVLYIRKAA